MSFCADCKQELCALAPEKPCCFLSELCGLYITTASLSLLGRGRLSVQFVSENLAVSRRAYTLLSKRLKLSPQLHYLSSNRFGGTRKCVLTLGPTAAPQLLGALGMLDGDPNGAWTLRATEPKPSLTRGCCARAYLRGVMLGGGTMANPETSYHLELPYQSDEARLRLAKCLQRLDLPIKDGARGEKRFLYLKQAEGELTFLAAIGAHQAVLRMQEIRLRKQLLGKINREMNCDAFNLQKQTNASARQVEAIERLRAVGALDGLPDALRELALLRLDMPDATLAQLGQSLDPPVGKSGVNHRMRRLLALAGTDDTEAGDPPEEDRET